jgi:L-ascorbate metabolism protein UlaG (beta-lactamase superfamily)
VVFIGHATVLIEVDGVHVLTDPVLRPRIAHLRRLAPLWAERPSLDAVLISHLHRDHTDLPSLQLLGRSRQLVVPRGARGFFRRRRFYDVVELDEGEATELGPVRVRAVHATHDGRRHPLGKKIAAAGYVVTGSRSLYFAGDTDLFDGMGELTGLDVALVPVAGWGPRVGPGHLDPQRAAEAVAMVRPCVAIPIHWGTLEPWHWRFSRGKGREDERPAEFAELVASLAPEVEVRILQPGERTEL